MESEIDISELGLENAQLVGKGALGEIRLVKWRGTMVAAKTILKPLSSNRQIVKEFIGELALLQSLRHPNIVQFLGAVTKTRPLVIVTEYFPKVISCFQFTSFSVVYSHSSTKSLWNCIQSVS
jgi:serine/threonine protein kinase